MKFREGGELECKPEILALDYTPWVEPIFYEPLNVYPLVASEEAVLF